MIEQTEVGAIDILRTSLGPLGPLGPVVPGGARGERLHAVAVVVAAAFNRVAVAGADHGRRDQGVGSGASVSTSRSASAS